ncbi:zinc ribbon domain-containing protein [Mycobacterium sp.]|uniref:zinc ribbon domain-containing protein n=1 Tax=Mycobacterium sp. TaxID=1785 RepID=UPI002BB3FC11|nr:zinc ribbon domain-containing protein [Mycobacterium sp.]HKP43344.1 zinc ribbon domain-containing protein [Mycobacterium sp.]
MTAPGLPTMPCPVCETDVPAGAFCGTCGAQLAQGRRRLRVGAYAAAPGEHALRLSVASTLFPHLPHRSRTPFRVALGVLFLLLVAFALLRMQAPLIAVSALGFPLLFILYLHEADVDDDLPVSSLALTAALGVILGIGWALFIGAIVANTYDVAISDGASEGRSMLEGLVAPTGAAVLMLVPALVVRLLRPATRESLDGFVIGALGAIGFTAAATLTRLAPQFATGATAGDRPINGLLVEAGIQGVAVPLTAVSVGGLFGVALWFTGSRRIARILLVSSIAVAIALYAALGLMEVVPLLEGLHFGLHMLVAVLALLALRIGIQTALLHEAHDEMQPSEQVLCPHCDHVVPDTAFCPNCGVASRAASRTSRDARRAPTGVPAARPGYAVPAGSYTAVPVRQTAYTGLLSALGAGLVVAVAAAITAAVLTTPVVPRYVCPPDCGRPPIGKPVEANPWFTSGDGKFAVQYPRAGTAYEVTLNPDGVEVNFTAGDTGTMEFFGLPAGDRSAKQIADDLIGEHYPDATTDYEIPNAMVGYQPGYGVVKDEYPQDASGTFTRLRLLVMVAIKDDYALVAAAIGPYHEFSPEFGSGHPSGANLQLALDMGKYVNSFTWRESAR